MVSKAALYERKRRQDRKRKGLCLQCAGPLDGPRSCCSACRQGNIERALLIQAHRRIDGRCIACGVKLGEPDMSMVTGRHTLRCIGCAEKQNLRRRGHTD